MCVYICVCSDVFLYVSVCRSTCTTYLFVYVSCFRVSVCMCLYVRLCVLACVRVCMCASALACALVFIRTVPRAVFLCKGTKFVVE